MKKTEKRKVFVTNRGGGIFVLYADRKYRQHHSPAQFDARDHTIETVRQWVIADGRFDLVDGPQQD